MSGAMRPWRTIWTRPRATVRWMAENDPMDWFWVLLVAGGTSRVMARLSELPIEGALTTNVLLSLVLIGGPIGGLLLIFAYGRVLHIVLKRLGGIATWVAARTAIAWSLAPGAPSLAVWAIMIATYGAEVLSPTALENATGAGEKLILSLDYFIQFALTMWSLVLEVVTLADVHRISVWKVLVSELALGVALVALAVLVVALV